jgi:NAD(P)-dependent dehydrogenase (short-subunit alcohol dehydrogenase family)
MDIAGRIAVVTGGGNGIGEALCHAFAQRGARAVVVADLNGADAERVAAEITAEAGAATARGVRVDVAVESDVVELVRRTEDELGPIDLFCSNAGIMTIGGVEVPDEQWQHMWQVNVASHIYAARALLPQMLARGDGYLLHTASAAGLLTQIGSAPYSVTKHAVVSLAEWLSITFGDAGIKVSCLCPQAVETAMIGSVRSRPRGDDLTTQVSRDGVLLPEQVAEAVIGGLAREEFLILPHPEVATYEQRRAGDRERWLRGMRRVQASMVAAFLAPDPAGNGQAADS